ncbi:pre-toxin TG domain-containing protein [Bacillus pacificus]|nr:pre-toxin TG domain-containing protein [Bacillus pacificus]
MGANDAIRAVTGKDPITGKELSSKERLIAAGWTLLNFVPVGKVASLAGKAGKAAVDGIKTASHKVKEGVNFVASTAKGFADKIGSLWNKGATTVKTTFLQGNEKIQHAVKTLMEYKWIPGEGKGFAMAGVGNVSGGGQYSLKEAYQYMASKVVKGTGEGGKGNSDLLDNTGRFKDAELQSKYDVYCERKYKNSEAPKEPLEWKEASEKWASLKEQGQEFSDESFNLFSQQYENAEREITIVTHEGTKVRVDAIASDEYGNVIIQEYKSSATAPYTTNQEKGFPELKNSGGKVVGEGKGDFSGGYEVPSGTRPQIVRPEGTTYFDE